MTASDEDPWSAFGSAVGSFQTAYSPGFFLTFSQYKPRYPHVTDLEIQRSQQVHDVPAIRVIEGTFIAHVLLAAVEQLIERRTGVALEECIRGPSIEKNRVAMQRRLSLELIDLIAEPWKGRPPHRLLFDTHGVRFCLRSPAHMQAVLGHLEDIVRDCTIQGTTDDCINPLWQAVGPNLILLNYLLTVQMFCRTHISPFTALHLFDEEGPKDNTQRLTPLLIPRTSDHPGHYEVAPFHPPLSIQGEWVWTSQLVPRYHLRYRFMDWLHSTSPADIYGVLHEVFPDSGWEKF